MQEVNAVSPPPLAVRDVLRLTGLWSVEETDDPLISALRDLWQAAGNIFDQFRASIDTIRTRLDLTESGKVGAIQPVADKTLSKLDRASTVILSNAAEEIARLEKTLATAPATGDPVVAALRAQEIRAHLSRLDPVGALAAIHSAITRDDGEVLRAVLTSPVAMTSPEIGSRIREAVLRANSPSQFARLLQLRQAVHVTGATVEAVRRAIESEAGQALTEPAVQIVANAADRRAALITSGFSASSEP